MHTYAELWYLSTRWTQVLGLQFFKFPRELEISVFNFVLLFLTQLTLTSFDSSAACFHSLAKILDNLTRGKMARTTQRGVPLPRPFET
mmetsp:Transcript_5029/g.7386  ORF Transcript_5029/g.7386 Transcript_5029/m.7386 type:complete len:88 (+) Transcript_5029:199-462(+)